MKKEINKMREILNKEIESGKSSYEKIINISKSLDQLIIKYHEEEHIKEEES